MTSAFHTPVPVKICGLTTEEDVDAAVSAGASAVGFVCYPPSPRYIPPERVLALAARLPDRVRPVLLFVNAQPAEILQLTRPVPGAIIQFHGDEDAVECRTIAAQAACAYWRAAHLPAEHPESFDLLRFARDNEGAAAILLDTQVPEYGGSGRRFDWRRLPATVPAHLVLSGGLNAGNVGQAIRLVRRIGLSLTVDVSSGVEATDQQGKPLKGIKDAAKMREFVAAVRAAPKTQETPDSDHEI